jgi:hypothetical protein
MTSVIKDYVLTVCWSRRQKRSPCCYWGRGLWNRGSIPLGEKWFLPSLRAQTGSGTDPVYCRMRPTEGGPFSPEVRRQGCKGDLSPQSSIKKRTGGVEPPLIHLQAILYNPSLTNDRKIMSYARGFHSQRQVHHKHVAKHQQPRGRAGASQVTGLTVVSVQICTESKLNLRFNNWNTMIEETREDTGKCSKVSKETAPRVVTWCTSRALCAPAQSGKCKLFDHEETRRQQKEANNTNKIGCIYIIM